MRRIIVIFVITFLLTGTVSYFTGLVFAPVAPEAEAGNMEKSISFARNINAGEFAPEKFKESIAIRNQAMEEWKKQNNLWIIRRDYKLTKELILKSTGLAIDAGKEAVEKKGNMEQFVSDTLSALQVRNQYFSEKFRNLPLDKEVLKKYSEVQLQIKEATEASARGEISNAYRILVIALEDFSQLEFTVSNKLRNYFESFSSWEKWYNQTIERSRANKSYAIVVDKMAHECILLKSGKVVERFEAELSMNWLTSKIQQGDMATPEGIYKVTRKIGSRETKYHKALLLNYPNEKDIARFENEVRSGNISSSAKIGGLIEIHGDGGKGKDWTDGCVALTNKDMDKLYSLVTSGTMVTIVGSVIPFEKIFN